jgi:hypothetical protein
LTSVHCRPRLSRYNAVISVLAALPADQRELDCVRDPPIGRILRRFGVNALAIIQREANPVAAASGTLQAEFSQHIAQQGNGLLSHGVIERHAQPSDRPMSFESDDASFASRHDKCIVKPGIAEGKGNIHL